MKVSTVHTALAHLICRLCLCPLPTTTAKAGATRGIIYVPDIFGVTSQAHQVWTYE